MMAYRTDGERESRESLLLVCLDDDDDDIHIWVCGDLGITKELPTGC